MNTLKNYSLAIQEIRLFLRNYITENKLRSLVLGVSGGIDSALVAALANPVCIELNIPLIGRSLTIETNKPDEILRAKEIGESFCTDFKEINLTDDYMKIKAKYNNPDEILTKDKETDREQKIRLGNIKVRMRMLYLYDLAQKNKGLVMSTDNYTEYLIGFWTLHGDVGDLGLIQTLWKTEVYEMSRNIVNNELKSQKATKALRACIDAIPTDGLGITNSDLEQICASTYEEVDIALYNYLETGTVMNEKVIARHLGSAYKRNNPYNLSRNSYDF